MGKAVRCANCSRKLQTFEQSYGLPNKKGLYCTSCWANHVVERIDTSVKKSTTMCAECGKELHHNEKHVHRMLKGFYCLKCYVKVTDEYARKHPLDAPECESPTSNNSQKVYKPGDVVYSDEPKQIIFNEPEHYHKYNIDTIQFLQEGFPPSVFKGFAIGSAIKYLHRYENKNGLEDLIKARDYVDRLIDWYQKTENPSK